MVEIRQFTLHENKGFRTPETQRKPSGNHPETYGFRKVSGWFPVCRKLGLSYFPDGFRWRFPYRFRKFTQWKPTGNLHETTSSRLVSRRFPVNRKLGLPYFQDGFRSVSLCSHSGNLPETTKFSGFRRLYFISMRFPVDIAAWFTEPNAIKLLFYTSF